MRAVSRCQLTQEAEYRLVLFYFIFLFYSKENIERTCQEERIVLDSVRWNVSNRENHVFHGGRVYLRHFIRCK